MTGMDHEVMMEDAKTLGLMMDEMGMSMDTGGLMKARPFDRALIDIDDPAPSARDRAPSCAKATTPSCGRSRGAIARAQQREILDMR